MKPLKAVIVGAGHRSLIYASLAKTEPDKLEIVGVADPDVIRRESAAKEFNIPKEHCFETAEDLANAEKFADVIINGTMDHIHVETSIPLLEMGYDMLLEKPFAVNEEQARKLIEVAKKNARKVVTCFVLRYASFYRKIKELILNGEIGEIISISTNEFVSYHHMSTSYVRGKWNNSEKCHSSMLLAKCSHDLDIMMWLMSETKPKLISSFGCNMQYRKENAPKNSGTRCLVDCPLVDDCLYSAKRIYIDHPARWTCYVWEGLEGIENPTIEDKINLLNSSDYGVCIYKSDNNVVDHQTVSVMFESGATGTHNMVGGASKGTRDIVITGTKGMIWGDLEEGKVTLSKIYPPSERGNKDTTFETSVENDSHGGGDLELVRDFVSYVRGEEQSISCTSIEDSFAGHLAVFLADKSMEEKGTPQVVTL